MSKLSYQAVAEREERIIKRYCDKEGLEYAGMSDDEKADILSIAEDYCDQERYDNNQFGLGA